MVAGIEAPSEKMKSRLVQVRDTLRHLLESGASAIGVNANAGTAKELRRTTKVRALTKILSNFFMIRPFLIIAL